MGAISKQFDPVGKHYVQIEMEKFGGGGGGGGGVWGGGGVGGGGGGECVCLGGSMRSRTESF